MIIARFRSSAAIRKFPGGDWDDRALSTGVGMSHIREFLDSLTHEALLDRLSLALDGASLGIWDWDLRDDSVQFDRRWCEMIGLDHATTPMQLETWRARVHPDDLEACYRDIRAHVEGRTERYENVHRMRHANGSWVYILDRGRISGRDQFGRPIRFTGTHFDVTAVERAREVLAHQERQLETLVASLPTDVLMLDLDRRVLAASQRWLQKHGSADEDYRGRRFDEVWPGAAARWGDAITLALAGENRLADEDAYDRAGKRRWLRWDARPWRTLDGAVGGAILCVEDISAVVLRRQQVERERETHLASLALFAGGIAHQINTPLQVVILEAEMIARELTRPAPNMALITESARAIASTASMAGAITRALRTLSRDARSDPASVVPVSELLQDVDSLCRKRFEGSSVSLEVLDRTRGAMVVGRPAELLHALLNLLHNAHDAAQQPGGWIRLEAVPRDEMVVFRCIDSGPGVAPEHVPRLMDPFFTTRPAGAGTGLGLPIAHAFATRDGGFLAYRPGEPHTTFEMGIPLSVPRAP